MKKQAVGGLLSVVGLLVVLGVGYFSGGDLGGECENDYFSCKGAVLDLFGPKCLVDMTTNKGYCTIECSTDADCGEMDPGWGCRGSSVIDEYGNETGETSNVCYSPQDILLLEGPQPGAQPQPVPGQPAPGQPVPQPVPTQ